MIPIRNIYNYGEVRRSEQNGTRHYLTENNTRVPSVTTILSKTKDITELLAWRRRIGEAAADQITRESTSLGTTMHTHLENHIRGEPRPGGNNLGRVMAQNMADVIIAQALSRVDEVWGIEVPLIYDTLWAGTTDLVGVFEGQPAIMDFKTTNRPKTSDRVEDYRLQLMAYIMGHNLSFGTDIKQGVIFMVSRDLTYQQFVITADQMDEYEIQWLLRVEKYYRDHM
jgi:hypothetical protein